MQNGKEVIDNLLSITSTLFFSFPIEKPTYIPISILGWKPANDQLTDASRQIFDALELVLNLEFNELGSVEEKNIIAISESIQSNTAGFSYFPNISYDLGSDIFISKEYSNPLFLNNTLTNYDYETLVHEIGHALGLKHPFESDGENEVVLDYVEDDTSHTAMSYDDYSHTFDGTFTAEEQDKDLGVKLNEELPGILNWAVRGCLDWQQQGLNPPQVVLDQVSAYKSEMDSIAQFIEQECSLEANAKYSASKLYETYRQFCQALGRKPQSTNAFKKALDKLLNVYQHRTSSGMQWHGIQPVVHL